MKHNKDITQRCVHQSKMKGKYIKKMSYIHKEEKGKCYTMYEFRTPAGSSVKSW